MWGVSYFFYQERLGSEALQLSVWKLIHRWLAIQKVFNGVLELSFCIARVWLVCYSIITQGLSCVGYLTDDFVQGSGGSSPLTTTHPKYHVAFSAALHGSFYSSNLTLSIYPFHSVGQIWRFYSSWESDIPSKINNKE